MTEPPQKIPLGLSLQRPAAARRGTSRGWGFAFGRRTPVEWCLVDCVRIQRYEFSEFPGAIGAEGLCSLQVDRRGNYSLAKTFATADVLLNGAPMQEVEPLEEMTEYSIKAGGNFYLLKGVTDVRAWIKGLNCHEWVIFDIAQREVVGRAPFEEISGLARRLGLRGYEAIATVEGAEQAFYIKDVMDGAARPAEPPPLPHPAGAAERRELEPVSINSVSGEFTCPHCWQHFDRGDVFWVAKHTDLRDPDLGEDYQQRFFPTSFDELGRAIDGMGMSCSAMACPHCKAKLPPQYLDLETHIISIVGAPSAGKSYFLTSLVHQLEETLPSRFGLSFQDGDASGNALVSDMRARLFSDSPNPADIALDKTVPGAEMFKTLVRDGRRVKLPKPFTYLVSPFAAGREDGKSLLLAFYDNAGEQFEPAERSEGAGSSDVDSTQHLASSAAIFFLYDPASNVRFRKLLAGRDDPQLSDERFQKLNRQDNIIAEMRNRIKSELHIDANDRLNTPLAMLIGKCDLWAGLIEPPFENPLGEGGLNLSAVERNSAHLREFLLRVGPGVVASAESISREVLYFPVSPIGHSPRPFVPPGEAVERIGPVPGEVNPLHVEIPALWVLTRLRPDMMRTCRVGPPAGW